PERESLGGSRDAGGGVGQAGPKPRGESRPVGALAGANGSDVGRDGGCHEEAFGAHATPAGSPRASETSSDSSEPREPRCDSPANGCRTSTIQPTSSRSPSQDGRAVRSCRRSPRASLDARRAFTGSQGTAARGGTSGTHRPSGRRNRSVSSGSRWTV